MKLMKLVAAVGVAIAASTAYAAVSFDAATGTGFVGKGDVQIAFDWNNAQLQANADSVTFSYSTEDKYDATCKWQTVTGNGTTIYHDVTVRRTVTLNKTVAYKARTNSQDSITGFNLTGFGAVSSNRDAPVDGGACLGGGGQQGVWSDVTLTSSTGGLYVNAPNKLSVLLPNTVM